MTNSTSSTIKFYTWGPGGAGPELSEIGTWPEFTDEQRTALAENGLSLDDEETVVCELAEDFEGHVAGLFVVVGLTAEGYSFAVVSAQ